MNSRLTTIILNYRNSDDTLACLNALKKSDWSRGFDYLVVDNSVEKASTEKLRAAIPSDKLLINKQNLGFAGGNNIGVKKALKNGSQYILIINPDVRVGKKFFSGLLANFKDNKVGIVAPAIKHVQKDRVVYGLEGKVDWSLAKPEHRNIPILKNKNPVDSQFVTFACVIIKKEVFEKTGLLDDGYFMYFEDVDYCLSALKKGFKIILDPGVIVTHRTSSSFKKPTDKLPISFKSHLRFIFKWLTFPALVKPLLYALTLYPYLYLLWSYHSVKYSHK